MPWNPSPTDIERIYYDASSRCGLAVHTTWDALSPEQRELMVRMVYATLRAADDREDANVS